MILIQVYKVRSEITCVRNTFYKLCYILHQPQSFKENNTQTIYLSGPVKPKEASQENREYRGFISTNTTGKFLH